MTTASPQDGWIPWSGGECPVPGETCVEVMFRAELRPSGTVVRAAGLRWNHLVSETFVGCGDIIAYRLAPATSPAPDGSVGDLVAELLTCVHQPSAKAGSTYWHVTAGKHVRFGEIIAELCALRHSPSAPADEGLGILIYAVEEDEDTIRLKVSGQVIAAWSAQGPQGIALLKLDAALKSKPATPAVNGVSEAMVEAAWQAVVERDNHITYATARAALIAALAARGTT